MHQAIGLIGRNGSGKSAVCDWFVTHGYQCVSLSDEVRRLARADAQPLTRDTLSAIGTALKHAHGSAILATRALEKWDKTGPVIFDSIRHPDEAAVLATAGVLLVGITAPLDLRYARIQARHTERDAVSLAVFKAQDDHEFYGHSKGHDIQACLKLCQYTLDNTYTNLTDLYAFMAKIVPTWHQPMRGN